MTVRWYVRQIYRKLDVHNRAQAIARVHQLDLFAADRSAIGSQAEGVANVIAAQSISFNDGKIANPYKGLRAFQESDVVDFFGRKALTKQLVARLNEISKDARFLTLVGPRAVVSRVLSKPD
jgi:conflict system STAND superfamily ATPase